MRPAREWPIVEPVSDSDPSGALLLIACAAMTDLAPPAEPSFGPPGPRVPAGATGKEPDVEDARFDGLVRVLGHGTNRRGALGLPAALAILGAGLGILAPEEAEGRKRRKRRKLGKDTHRDQRNGHVTDEKKKKKKKKKKKPQPPVCTPDAKTTTCAGKCGSVTNNCGQAVDCGSCDCAPDTKGTTCAGKCGSVTNNCGLAVDCGSCACVPACEECFTCTGSPSTCVPAERGTPCGATTCDNGTLQPRGTCDGAGICEPGSPEPCAPYTQCDGNACATTCAGEADCVAGSFCNQGQCVGDGPNGASCSHDGQCQSGVCAQGVCCNKACAGSCAACDLSGTVGTCTTRADGAPCSTGGGNVCCAGTCQSCCGNLDCPGSAPFCTNGTCEPCRTNPHACPSGTCCDWEGGACVATCPNSAPMCDSQGNNFCVPSCNRHTDCPNSGAQKYICVDHICRACDGMEDILGPWSAADAIASARAGQTVYVCPGTYFGVRWSPGDFLFSNPITVIGAGDGAGGTVLSGRVRTPPSGTTLRGLQISGAAQGVSLEGGGVTLIDCTVRGNQIGVLNAGGTVEMQRCNVVSNTPGGGIRNVGGAITLRNSTVEQNTATQGAGIYSESAPGFGFPDASVTLYDTKVRGNTATTSGGGIASGGNNAQVNFYGTTMVCGNSPADSQCTGFTNSACTTTCP